MHTASRVFGRPSANTRARSTEFSFQCTACGKCCNSGPQLSLREMFTHERRFLGVLTVRRVPLVGTGDLLGRGLRADDDDARAFSKLAARILHPLHARGEGVALALQAFYDVGATRCPMLSADNRCTLHELGKPRACEVAPLEAWLPDRLQHEVLRGRLTESEYHGTDCIGEGARPNTKVVTRRLEVVDAQSRTALDARRADLEHDKRLWGDSVFRHLEPALFRSPEALAQIPVGGFLSIPIAPALAAVASCSERLRQRCLQFLHAQRPLLLAALQSAEGLTRTELAAHLESHTKLAGALSTPRAQLTHPLATDLEAWLALSPRPLDEEERACR